MGDFCACDGGIEGRREAGILAAHVPVVPEASRPAGSIAGFSIL